MKERITEYLIAGGLFNPELMEHDKVRNLLMDARDYIDFLERRLNHADEMYEKTMVMSKNIMGKLK